MNGRRRHTEVALHVRLRWSHPVDLGVRLDEREVLTLQMRPPPVRLLRPHTSSSSRWSLPRVRRTPALSHGPCGAPLAASARQPMPTRGRKGRDTRDRRLQRGRSAARSVLRPPTQANIPSWRTTTALELPPATAMTWLVPAHLGFCCRHNRNGKGRVEKLLDSGNILGLVGLNAEDDLPSALVAEREDLFRPTLVSNTRYCGSLG